MVSLSAGCMLAATLLLNLNPNTHPKTHSQIDGVRGARVHVYFLALLCHTCQVNTSVVSVGDNVSDPDFGNPVPDDIKHVLCDVVGEGSNLPLLINLFQETTALMLACTAIEGPARSKTPTTIKLSWSWCQDRKVV